jgi:hypothetical protein
MCAANAPAWGDSNAALPATTCIFNDIPVSASKCVYYQQHSRFFASFPQRPFVFNKIRGSFFQFWRIQNNSRQVAKAKSFLCLATFAHSAPWREGGLSIHALS